MLETSSCLAGEEIGEVIGGMGETFDWLVVGEIGIFFADLNAFMWILFERAFLA